MKIILYSLFILFTLNSNASKNETSNTIFEGYESATFKLKYLVTEGYSISDRYEYEIIIVDSLLILNFHCPKNDDWNFIEYQKHMILHDEQLERIKWVLKKARLSQKSEGFPHWSDWAGSGYGAYRLHIESENVNVAGGMIYNCMGSGEEDLEKMNKKQRKESTTIGGNYEFLFTEIKKLFDSLPFLMEDKNRKY